METKEILSLLISTVALVVSGFALYFSHWHKPAKAILCLNSRLFDCVNGQKRELHYTISNNGSQELYIKEICILRGKSPLGNLRSDSSYLEIPTDETASFILKAGEIKAFTLKHELNYALPPGYFEKKNKYILVCLEIISSAGKRFQMVHDISDLGPSGPDIKDPIWSGVPLGKNI